MTQSTTDELIAIARAGMFFREFYLRVGRDRTGGQLQPSAVIDLVNDTIDAAWAADRHVSLVTPPGFGKSTFARLKMLFALGNNPNLNFAFISATKSTAEEGVGTCRAIIARDPPAGKRFNSYCEVFPNIEPDYVRSQTQGHGSNRAARSWKKDAFFIRRGESQAADPTLAAHACTTTSEAIRIDRAIFDDVMTREIAGSDAKREDNISAVFNTWLEGRLLDWDDRGKALFMQNCWNDRDLAHVLRAKESVTSIWIGIDESNTSFRIEITNCPGAHPIVEDPDRYDAELVEDSDGARVYSMPFPPGHSIYNSQSLDDAEKSNPDTFVRAFRLQGVTSKSLMFPSWTKRKTSPLTTAEAFGLRLDRYGFPTMTEFDRARLAVALGVDFSSQKRPGNWITASCLERASAQRGIIEQRNGDWSLSEFLDILAMMWERMRWHVLFMEDNALQSQLIEVVRGDVRSLPFRHTIMNFTTGLNKRSDELGLPSLDLKISNGTYVFGDQDPVGTGFAESSRSFRAAVARLPRVHPRGTTPDSLMSWWFSDSGLDMAAKYVAGAQGIDADRRNETQSALSGYVSGAASGVGAMTASDVLNGY